MKTIKLIRAHRLAPDTIEHIEVPAALDALIPSLETDVSFELCKSAYNGTSQFPESTGHRTRNGWIEGIIQDWEKYTKHARNPEKLEILEDLFPKYYGQILELFKSWLHSHSRCMSSFITGPANFPTRRAQKRNDYEHAAYGRYLDACEKWNKRIMLDLYPEHKPVKSSDADAAERLKEKIAALEAHQENMKAINKICRDAPRYKETPEKNAILTEKYGLGGKSLHNLWHPDWGKPGIGGWELSNNNANIRRLKERLASIEKAKATPAQDQEIGGGIRVEINPSENRIRIYYPGKPDTEERDALKSHGFRWAPSMKAWSAFINYNSKSFTQHLKTRMAAEEAA